MGVYHSEIHHMLGELTLYCATYEGSKESLSQKSYCISQDWNHEQFELC